MSVTEVIHDSPPTTSSDVSNPCVKVEIVGIQMLPHVNLSKDHYERLDHVFEVYDYYDGPMEPDQQVAYLCRVTRHGHGWVKNHLYRWDNGWIGMTPKKGDHIVLEKTQKRLFYTGTRWIDDQWYWRIWSCLICC